MSESSNDFSANKEQQSIEIEDRVQPDKDETILSNFQQRSDNISQSPTTADSSPNPLQNIDWQKVAHKLREHNRKLLKRIFTLEQELTETNYQYQEQKAQTNNSELLIGQQAERLNCYQEEIACLLEQVEKQKHQEKSQQIVVDRLSEQLAKSQQQNAKLERDCAKLKDINNEKNHQLFSKKQQLQEFNARLNREQQKLLKYQSALENSTNQGNIAENASNPIKQLVSKPISAWSAKMNKAQPNNETKTATPDWPAPAITKAKPSKQPQSLGAVKLPSFGRQNSSEG